MALDGRGRVTAWNRAAERLSGYDLHALSGDGWKKLFPGKAAQREFQRARAARAGKAFKAWTWRITTSTGESRVVQWSSIPGRRAANAPVRAHGQDVTELQAIRDELQATTEFLRIAQKTGNFGAWSYDPAAKAVNYTPELETIYGVRPGRFGRKYTDFRRRVYPEDLARIEPIRDRAVARREPFEYDIRVRDDDGQTRWIKVRGRGLYDPAGRLQRMVGIDSDVTERVQTRQALAEKSAYLDAILRSEAVIVFHQDRDLRYTAVINPALGLVEKQARGKTDEDLLGQEAAAHLTQPKKRVLRTGKGERLEIEVTRGSQSGDYDLIIEPERDERGNITGIVCAAIDISQRLKAQRELEQTNRRLQELAAHLQESIEAERIAVARDVHDQIGATLTAIRMRLTTIAGRAPPTQPSQRADLISIAALAESAMHATRDICSRLRPPALEDIGLAETCRWYLQEWSRTTRIATTGRFPNCERSLDLACSTDVFRILQELLTNVARHSGATRVLVTLSCARHHVRLRVRDDGHGFDPAIAAHGFGLAGIHERARHHGGSVEMQSSAHGTTIDVMMPSGGDA